MERVALFLLEDRTSTVRLYADVQNFDRIRAYISGSEIVKDEFRDEWGILKENLKNDEKYRKVKAILKGKDLYVMVFKESGSSDWILCIDGRGRKVRNIIMINLFTSITEEFLNGIVVHEIEKKGAFDYELEE